MTLDAASVGDLLRPLAPQVLGVLVRRFGMFDRCEDAVQEALLAASLQWPEQGLPDEPRAWLVTVASRRLTDQLRNEEARRRREDADAVRTPADAAWAPAPDEQVGAPDGDDTLTLLFLCCHPALSPPSQLALTARAVAGLTTGEIARAFLVPESTMGQRISRAKQRIRDAGATFAPPPPDEWPDRLQVVLHVLYLLFNEGYSATAGEALQRHDLTAEALRLTREVHRLLPDDDEVTGLLALIVLTDARRSARTGPDGALIPLAEQDRSGWDRAAIDEGVALVSGVLGTGPVGPYQLQAAIAAVHDEAERAEDTDWLQIVALYDVLSAIAPNPVVTLNRAVAVGMARGPAAGLAALAALDGDQRMADHHRVDVARAHLLELAGDVEAARELLRRAARRTTSLPEQRYLERRAASLGAAGVHRPGSGAGGGALGPPPRT